MMSITEHEYKMILRCSKAIDVMVDEGSWERRGDELVFVIPEKAADRILELIDGDCEAEDD